MWISDSNCSNSCATKKIYFFLCARCLLLLSTPFPGHLIRKCVPSVVHRNHFNTYSGLLDRNLFSASTNERWSNRNKTSNVSLMESITHAHENETFYLTCLCKILKSQIQALPKQGRVILIMHSSSKRTFLGYIRAHMSACQRKHYPQAVVLWVMQHH